METTKFYQFPLQWDQYDDDRHLLREALIRIDLAISEGGGSEVASGITYDGAEAASPTETVADALDRLSARTKTFEIATSATGGANTGEVLWVFDVTLPFTLPADLIGSRGSVLQLGPLDMVIRLEKGSTPIGQINIVNNALSFDFPDEQTFVAGDILVLTSNDTTTFRSVSVTLLADVSG